MNIIFLDIDGVLNGAFSFSQCHNWVGIGDALDERWKNDYHY